MEKLLQARKIRLEQTATGKKKKAPKPSPWVFPGKTKAGHRATVAKEFERAREAAGLDKKVVLYLARHMFGTTFLKGGGDLATLMKIMGHTDIKTTAKYLHANNEGAADVINRRNRGRLKLVKTT
jgi:integrase/recombinase XerD